MSTNTLYADRLLNLSMSNGMIRLEFGIVENYQEGEERKQRAETTHRVVLPADGFLRSFAMQQRLVDQLGERAKTAREQAADKQTEGTN